MIRCPLRLLVLGFITLAAGWSTPASAAGSFIVAVVPQFAPSDINRDWSPLLEQLGKMTGHQFQLRLYDNAARFEADFKNGIPDFVFLNPYHMVQAKRAQGYLPLVRDGNQLLRGILVVRNDSPIRQISDLNQKLVAFPSITAFGASLYMRALLIENEKIKIHPVYVGTHQNAYRHVMLGEAAAGGGIHATLKKEPGQVQAHLRIIYTTPDTPAHPIAAHPRVPASIRAQIQQALIRLADDPQGQKLLNPIQMRKPIAADFARDYAPLEKLKLDRYAGAVSEKP